MTETIELGSGARAALAMPTGSARPGLVLVHEWHGLNDGIRGMADRFAAEGFATCAPDLYGGEVATDDARAAALMNGMRWGPAIDHIASAVGALADRGCQKFGIVGFCMGGGLALAASSAVAGFSCVVPFYGLPSEDYFRPGMIRGHVQAHFAERDGWAKPEKAAELARIVNGSGGAMELHVYPAGHAFMRSWDAKVYDAASAEIAWARTLAFLHEHVG